MFLPTTSKEMVAFGWQQADIILVTGDTYIDSPFMGVALLANYLYSHGFRVAVIAQPDSTTDRDITRLGEPRLFWGVTGGAVDSLVANYTASGRRRKHDDYTPGGNNSRRPDRAVIVYANLIRRYCGKDVPLVLGGIEASLRRIAHYDFWSKSIRRSILFDARADYLAFGMAHSSVLELARALRDGHDPSSIRGLCYIAQEKKGIELPSYAEVVAEKRVYAESFQLFYANMDGVTGRELCQRHGDRWLILNRPPLLPTVAEMDELHELDYRRDVHPWYGRQGKVRALDTLGFSIPTHYGCYGECNFCAIAVHQGRTVSSRSRESIVREAKLLTTLPGFKGYIHDLGGPTANMYGYECRKKLAKGACTNRRCLFPKICPSLQPDHGPQLALLEEISALPGVRKVCISSGIRHDLILADRKHGRAYLEALCRNHVSGQLKLAPEHSSSEVLKLMGKETVDDLLAFKKLFDTLSRQAGKKQFLTYYFIAAHPGCSREEMARARKFCLQRLKILPKQVQIFTPTPSTWSTLFYYTGRNSDGEKIFVERDVYRKEQQKAALVEPSAFREKGRGKRIYKIYKKK